MAKSTANDDGSLVFSLRELERLEQDRIVAERAAADARRLAAERARRETEAMRRKQAEELRAEAERARRDEAARETALARAEMERVRAEVEVRARAEQETARRAHELELAQRRGAILRGRHRWLTGASLVVTLASAAFASLVSFELRSAEAALRERSAAYGREREARLRSAKDLAETNARLEELATRLAALRAAPAASSPAVVPKSAPHPSPPKGRPHSRGEPDCTGADGDPLNGCLR